MLWLVLISPPAQWLWRQWAIAQLSQAAGGPVKLTYFGTNLLNWMELRGLSIESADPTIPHLTIGHLEIYFNPIALFTDAAPLTRVSAIDLQLHSRQTTPQQRATDWRELLAPPTRVKIPAALLRWLPDAMHLLDLEILAPTGEHRLALQGPIQLTVERRSKSLVDLRLLAADILLVRPGRSFGPLSLDGALQIGPNYLRLHHLQATHPDLNGSLQANYSPHRYSTRLDLAGRLEPLQHFAGLGPALTGAFRLHLDAARDSLSDRGILDVDLNDCAYQGRPLESLILRSRYQGGDMRLDSLIVGAAGGFLSGSGHLDLNAAGRPFDVNLAVDGLQADRLARLITGSGFALRGRLDGKLRALGRLDGEGLRVAAFSLASTDLHLGGADLGQSQLSASYEAPFLRGRIHSQAGDLAVSGRVDHTLDHRLHWRLTGLDLSRLRRIVGSSTLAGHLDLHAQSQGHIARPAVQLQGELNDPRWGPLHLERIGAQAQIDTSATFRLHLTGLDRSVGLDLAGDLLEIGAGRLHLRLDDLPLSHFLTPAAAGLWAARIGLELDFSGSIEKPLARSVFRLRDITYADQLFGDAQGTLDLAEGRSRLSLAALDSTVRLDGSLYIDHQHMPFELAGQVQRTDLAPFLQLGAARAIEHQGYFSGALQATGQLQKLNDLQLNLALDQLQVDGPQGALVLSHPATISLRQGVGRINKLAIGGPLGRLQLNGHIARDGPVDLTLDLADFQLVTLEPFFFVRDRGLAGILSATGTLSGHSKNLRAQGQLHLQRMHYADAAFGTLHSEFAYRNGRLNLRQMTLQLPQGQLRGSGYIPLGPHASGLRLDLQAEAITIDSAQGLPPEVRIRTDGQLHLRGPGLELADLRGEFALETLAVTAGPFTLQALRPLNLYYDEGLAVDSLDLQISGGQTIGQISASGRLGPGRLHLACRALDLAAAAQLLGLDEQVEGLIDADADLSGSLQSPHGALSWVLSDARYNAWQLDRFAGQAIYRDQILDIEQLQLDLAGGAAQIKAVLPLTPYGSWRPDIPLQVELHADSLDLSRLPLPHPELEAFAGRGRVDLRLAGPIDDLQPTGHFALIDGHVKVRGLEPSLRVAKGTVTVGDGHLKIDGFSGDSGGGKWALSGGAQLAGTRPDTFSFTLDAENLTWTVPDAFELNSGGQLTWRGTPRASHLAGTLQVAHGKITAPLNLRTSTTATTPEPTATDTLTTNTAFDRVSLDVKLELTQLQLLNDLMELELAGQIALAGHAAAPILSGRVAAQTGGTVFYLGQRFALNRATLDFRNPYALRSIYTLFYYPGAVDPTLDIAARTELKAINGNEYFIDVGVTGPVSALGFQLVSDPPRSHVEILSLLSFGRDDVQLLDPEGAILNRQNRVQLSPDYLMRVAQMRFSRVFGVDKISIDESTFKPRSMGGTRITLSKQLSNKAEMTYSTSVGYASKGRVRLNYALDENISLQTERDAEGESGMDLKLKLEFR